VERKEDQDQYVYNRLPVETQGPVRFFVLVEEEIAGQYLDAQKGNKANAAYSVKKPDKHDCSLALFSSNHITAVTALSRVFRRNAARRRAWSFRLAARRKLWKSGYNLL